MPAHSGTHALERQVAELRSYHAASTQLVDALNTLALALWRVDLVRALSAAQEARILARLLGYHTGAATSLVRLSWIHLQSGEFDTAVREAHEAKRFAEQNADTYVLVLNARYTLARAYQLAGEFKKAEAAWQQMRAIARANNDTLREADYQFEAGLLYIEMRDYQRAFECALQAKDFYATLDDPRLATALNNMAFALTKLGHHDQALILAVDALARCDPERMVTRAEFLHTLGMIHLNRREHDLARACLDESLRISLSPSGQKYTAVEALTDIAKLETVGNNITVAVQTLERAAALAGEIHSHTLQAEAQQALSQLYLLLHDPAGANAHHERYIEHKFIAGIERVAKRVSLICIEAEVEGRHPVWAAQGLR